MEIDEFRKRGYELIDWLAEYFTSIEKYPVKSQVKPGEIYQLLPDAPPDFPESFDLILKDFEEKILKGVTHWQNPSFHAYFTGNTSFPSILGEILTAGLAAQCMVWETSPAAAELEQKVTEWLRDLLDLPKTWSGVIQDGASTATLCAILAAREKFSNYTTNRKGLYNKKKLRVYCSDQTHSSVEKAIKIMGMGADNLVKIRSKPDYSIDTEALEMVIEKDLDENLQPLCVIGTSGTTSSLAFDDLKAISNTCQKYDLWFHVDAAYAGSAAICEEYRWVNKGAELADSYVFNPHKWLFTNFDCSILFVKNKEDLTRALAIQPEYLKTKMDSQVNNYRDWGIQLGRRFRALKLWFVLRSFGTTGLQKMIKKHVGIAHEFEKMLAADNRFEIIIPAKLSLVCFRYHSSQLGEEKLNAFNKDLNSRLNQTGKVYLTHTVLVGKYVLRAVFSATLVELQHAEKLYHLLDEIVSDLLASG